MVQKKLYTLVFIKNPNTSSVLMGRKARGLGRGFWNGFGGKVEKDETISNCAKREIQEECNLIISDEDLHHIGVLQITFDNDISSIVHIFTCSKYQGVEEPSEEMNPIEWFQIENVPFEHMWPDSRSWLHIALNERYFSARVFYTDGAIDRIEVAEHTNLTNALNLTH